MRTIVILSSGVIATAVLAFYILQRAPATKQPGATAPSTPKTPHPARNPTVNHASRLHPTLMEQPERAEVNDRLAAIEAELGDLRAAASPPAADEAAADDESQRPNPERFTSGDFGRWLDETLRVQEWDPEWTALASEQAQHTVARVPGLELESLECGRRFCRASLSHESGERPTLDQFFGRPPFLKAGFTLHEPDGRLALYFVRPGESFAKLREEAREGASN